MNVSLPRARLSDANTEMTTAFSHYTELNRFRDDLSEFNCGASRASTAVLRSSPGTRSSESVRHKNGAKQTNSLGEDVHSKWGILSKRDSVILILAFSLRSLHVTNILKSSWDFGGGVYVIARLLSTWILALPILLLEVSLGRSSRLGPLRMFHGLRPVFMGIGMVCLTVSIYSSVVDAVTSMWSVSQLINNSSMLTLPLVFPPEEPRNESFPQLNLNSIELELPLVIGLAIFWAIVMILAVSGLRLIKMISYLTVTAMVSLLAAFIVRQYSVDHVRAAEMFSEFVRSDWQQLLQLTVWIRASIDTISAYRFATGVNILIGKETAPSISLLTSTVIVSLLHTVIVGLFFVLCGSLDWILTDDIVTWIPDSFGYPWLVVFNTAVLLLNVIGVSLMATVLSTSWAIAARWRPVITILVCGILFLLGVPFTTKYGTLLYRLISENTLLLPVGAVLLSLVAVCSGCGLRLLISSLEISANKKLDLFWRSLFVTLCTLAIPLALIGCIVQCSLGLNDVPSGLAQRLVFGLTFAPFVLVVAAPLFIVFFEYRHRSFAKRLKKLLRNSETKHWAVSEEERSHYELPERVAPVALGHNGAGYGANPWSR